MAPAVRNTGNEASASRGEEEGEEGGGERQKGGAQAVGGDGERDVAEREEAQRDERHGGGQLDVGVARRHQRPRPAGELVEDRRRPPHGPAPGRLAVERREGI